MQNTFRLLYNFHIFDFLLSCSETLEYRNLSDRD